MNARLPDRPRYPAHRYDDQLLLKIPGTLWLIMAYAAHPAALWVLTTLPKGGANFAYLRAYIDPIALIISLPAAFVIAASVMRKPGSGSCWRFIWNHGRAFTVTAIMLHGAFVIDGSPFPLDINAPVPMAVRPYLLAVDIFALTFLLSSRLVRDVFRDFPH